MPEEKPSDDIKKFLADRKAFDDKLAKLSYQAKGGVLLDGTHESRPGRHLGQVPLEIHLA